MKDIITVPDSGLKDWSGGARTFAFVYSNKGNFIVKGYYNEVDQYLENLTRKGYKWFANFTLWYSGQSRNIWKFWKPGVYIQDPSLYRNGKWTKWEVNDFKTRKCLTFKRLPKKWIPEFDEF